MRTIIVMTMAVILSACAPKPEPYTIAACIDGRQVADFRKHCLGQRPEIGVPPVDGQFDYDQCSTIRVVISDACGDAGMVDADVILNP